MKFPLVGNNKIRLAIENILNHCRLPHAILMDGDIGTGRNTLADFIANAAVCGKENAPCDICHNCHLAQTGNHPDIIYISPEEGKKNISVSQIRDLKSNVYIKPHEAKNKVFIIHPADTLNEQSQNALLKILEEPPESTVFILIAENKSTLLETVISRCVVLSLNVPTLNEARDYLSANTDFLIEDIQNSLTVSNNNIGKALMILKGKDDTESSIAAKEFLSYALRDDQWGMITIIHQFEKSRIEADRFFKDLKLAVINEIKKNTSSIYAPYLMKFYTVLTELEKSLVTNINLTLLFSALVSRAKECIL